MEVVARVGEKLLTEDEVKAWESTLPDGKPSASLRASFIRSWVEKELLYQAALERGIGDDPWVESRLEDIRRDLLTARLLELDEELQSPPSTKDVILYYEKHKDEFVWKNTYLEIQYWQCSERQPLDKLRLSLTQARPSPSHPDNSTLVDSGSFSIDDPLEVDPAIWRHLSWMSSGQLSYPILYNYMFWMFRIIRREEANTPQRLDDVVDVITNRLVVDARINRRTELIRRYAEQFRTEGRLQWTDDFQQPESSLTPKSK